MRIRYLDGDRLRRALLAACDHARLSPTESTLSRSRWCTTSACSAMASKPILRVGPAGSAEPISKVRGYKSLVPRTLDLLSEEIGKGRKIRFGVAHVDAPEVAEEIRAALLERFGPREILISPATPAIVTHVGRRAWGLAYMVEDD